MVQLSLFLLYHAPGLLQSTASALLSISLDSDTRSIEEEHQELKKSLQFRLSCRALGLGV